MREEIDAGTPIVVAEPACASVFKDELVNLDAQSPRAKRLSAQVSFISDFVAKRAGTRALAQGGKALVQAHCHHHAVIGFDAEAALLARMGIEVDRAHGCCGMAGAFGMAEETFDVGQAIGERSLLPRVRNLPEDVLIVADGFSCREQIELNGGRKTLHIAELLRERLSP
jgi:Fe-S oxidoreductase